VKTVGTHVGFRSGGLAQPIANRLTDGIAAGALAQRDLRRYYDAMAAELQAIEFTEAEASLIVAALKPGGPPVAPVYLPLVVQRFMDQHSAVKQVGLEVRSLLEKLRALNPAACLAIIDAAEQVWITVAAISEGRAQRTRSRDILKRVGLIK
jgi:hypothetical protein